MRDGCGQQDDVLFHALHENGQKKKKKMSFPDKILPANEASHLWQL